MPKIIINIFSAAGQTIVQIVVLLMLYRHLITSIGVEQMGIWSVVMAVASSARMSELGFGGSIVKFVAAYQARGDDQATAEILQTAAITVAVLFAIVAAAAYPLFYMALPRILPTSGLDLGRAILPYGLVSLWLTSVSSVWMNALDASFRSDLRAGTMIFCSLVYFLSALVGVKFYGLIGLAAAQVAQGLFLVISGWFLIRQVMHLVPIFPNRWKLQRCKEMIGYGLNFQIHSVVAFLFEPATKILVGRYGGMSAAGYFEMAQRMVVSVRTLVVESNRVIVPVYAGMTSYETDAPDLYARNTRSLLFLVTPVFAVLMALTPVLCEVWVGSYQPQFVIMGAWLTFAWFLNTVSTPAYFAYLGQGKLRWITMAHIIMGAANIIAGFVLGRIFGWQGILASFVGSLVLASFIPVWAYHHEHRIKNIQFFTVYDMVSAGVCFTSAVIALASYWIVLDASLMDKWERVTMFTGIVLFLSAAVIWFHPLRWKLIDRISKISAQY